MLDTHQTVGEGNAGHPPRRKCWTPTKPWEMLDTHQTGLTPLSQRFSAVLMGEAVYVFRALI
jgi:hypothetical protein